MSRSICKESSTSKWQQKIHHRTQQQPAGIGKVANAWLIPKVSKQDNGIKELRTLIRGGLKILMWHVSRQKTNCKWREVTTRRTRESRFSLSIGHNDRKEVCLHSEYDPLVGIIKKPGLSIPAKKNICMITLYEVLENKGENAECMFIRILGRKIVLNCSRYCEVWCLHVCWVTHTLHVGKRYNIEQVTNRKQKAVDSTKEGQSSTENEPSV